MTDQPTPEQLDPAGGGVGGVADLSFWETMTLRHIGAIARPGLIGALCPQAEMIRAAESLTAKGLAIQVMDGPARGRHLTDAGRSLFLSEMRG